MGGPTPLTLWLSGQRSFATSTSLLLRTYSAGESAGTVVGLSSDPGQGVIIAARDYERQFSAHLLDWAAFAVMTLPSLGIPFLLWWSSKSKYEAIMLNKAE